MTPPSGTVQHYTSYVRRPLSVWSRNNVVVHLVFFFKSDHKIPSYGHFNIIAQECTRELKVLIQN